MSHLSDLSIHVNGEEALFLNEKIMSAYSGRLRKMIKEEKRQSWMMSIKIENFPGGSNGLELVSRFCYNNGGIKITVSNVCVLYCCAMFLEMAENLLKQTETFLEGIFYWSWNEILIALKTCDDSIFSYADSYGLLDKLICGVLAKIAQNSNVSDESSPSPPSSSSSSSSNKSKQWWFDELSTLPPVIIEKLIKSLGAFGEDNDCLIITKFIIHYLRNRVKGDYEDICSGLADSAVCGVLRLSGKSFSCRGLLWILNTVSGFGLKRELRVKLERKIGSMIDEATLDDLLISSGQDKGVYYDVKLVLRLIRIFVNVNNNDYQKMKKVGKLIDKYLGEISPDPNLKISKFLGVAQSLPDSARDCFDGVYKAIDMYLQSHPTLSFEERSRLCKCLNYEKLSLGACKDLAKNPRIPPNIAIQALKSQTQSNDESLSQENEYMKINIERMQRRVIQLEKACKEMKGQISFLVRHNVTSSPTRALPRLC